MKYLKVWWLFSKNTFDRQAFVRGTWLVFLLAKLIRFFMFTLFIVVLVSKTNALAGYNIDQTIFFFLSFNLIEVLTQTLFRDVYRFRPQVINGTFDFYLSKPLNPLFRALLSGPDILDFFTLIPLIIGVIYYICRLNIVDPLSIFLYLFLLGVALLISMSFHILVLSLAIITTEIDHAIMLYRDVTGMGRFPVDIYGEPIRGILTFIIPVGIMMSFPVKALLGSLSPISIVYAWIFSLLLFYLSLRIWNFALKQYSSASS